MQVEEIETSGGKDRLIGNNSNNWLMSSGGNDTLMGGGGNDTLFGGSGNDSLQGGSGRDVFVFENQLQRNVDVIVGFKHVDDTIRLENYYFRGLATGRLEAGAFRANNSGFAADRTDRIIFEKDTGSLFFDSDGSGGAARVKFAVLSGAYQMPDYSDFSVF